MIYGPFGELYVAARLANDVKPQRPIAAARRPLWAQWLALALVRLAASLTGAHVRIEYGNARTTEPAS